MNNTITRNCIVTLVCQLSDTKGNLLEEKQELIYLHGGYDQIFRPMETMLEGKKMGQHFKIEISAAEAFGLFDESLIVSEELSNLPEDLEVGMEIEGYIEENEEDVILYTVTKISDTHAILDANHPLAGIDLVFEGKIEEIIEANEETIQEILNQDSHH